MRHSEKINEIMPALIKAKSEMGKAIRNAENPHFKSAYVTLDAVINAAEPALLKNGVMVIQATEATDTGNTVLHTRLIHTSGQWIGSTYPVHPVKPGPQNEGSALTYARRYGLMGVLNIAPEDDDGNAAQAAVAVKAASPKQVADIKAALIATHADEAAFLKWLQADSVESLTEQQAQRALAALAKKAAA